MLILKDRNPSRDLTDDESPGVWPAELESVCTAPQILSPFCVRLVQCQPCGFAVMHLLFR